MGGAFRLQDAHCGLRRGHACHIGHSSFRSGSLSGRLPSGEPLDTAQQRRVVEVAVAAGARRGHQLRGDRAERKDHAGLSRGRGDDPHVLVVQVDAKARVKRSAQHVLALLLEHLGAGQPTPEHVERSLGVDAVGLEEYERFGERLDVDADDQLVGRLDRLARAARADVHDRPADRVEDRLGGREVLGRTADHDRQDSVLGPGLAAGDGRVEEPEVPLGRARGQLGGDVGPDAREVDDERARQRRCRTRRPGR